jgi:hypothetical protein
MDPLKTLPRKLGYHSALSFLAHRVTVLDKPSRDESVEPKLIEALKEYLNQEDVILDSAESLWTCPVLQQSIAIPCACKDCYLWAPVKDFKNCLGYYSDHKRKIKPKELAKMKGDKTLEVLALRGELGIRGASFKELARTEGYPVFEFLPQASVCCVCESRLMAGDKPEQVGYRTGLMTCSADCRKQNREIEILCQYFAGMTLKNTTKYMKILLGKESRDNFLSALTRLSEDKTAKRWND